MNSTKSGAPSFHNETCFTLLLEKFQIIKKKHLDENKHIEEENVELRD